MPALRRLVVGLFVLSMWLITIGTAQAASRPEPTGGQWKTIVLPSGDAVAIPPPPPAAGEIAALRSRQARRTAAITAGVRYWDADGCVRWNEIARGLVSAHQTSPPLATRVYALLSVAQYDTLVAVWQGKYRYRRPAPSQVDSSIVPLVATSGDPVYPCDAAAIGAASSAVLSYLYPDYAASLARSAAEEAESRLWAGVNYPSDLAAGEKVGHAVAAMVIARASTDRSDAAWTGTVPVGPGIWHSLSSPPQPPMQPQWGGVRTWLVPSVAQMRPAPPPAYGSPAFKEALLVVRNISDHRTPEQIAIARYWADGAGTPTPAGHWNQIACDLITRDGWNELRAARALALLNMAEMDAGICCWDAKYTYWLLRPQQADPAITMAVPLPNFPSYTSGHSTFSGAAAEVLGYLFPADSDSLQAMAEEAGISRIYAGIHYPFDNAAGLYQGRLIGQLAIERGEQDGSPYARGG